MGRYQKHTPVRVRDNTKTFNGTPRSEHLAAHKLSPWQMLMVMVRYQAGESSQTIAQAFGINHQTVVRWHRAYGHDTKHIHKAAAQSVLAHELVEARLELAELKAEIDRRLARLERVIKKHNVRLTIDDLYPEDGLTLKVQGNR